MVGVFDGDSITVLTVDMARVKIRLDGIDAPEAKQAFGAKAKAGKRGLWIDAGPVPPWGFRKGR